MSEFTESMQPVAEYTKVESIFVRHRNCLLIRANFTPIFTDYYLHLMEQKIRHKEELDETLKDLLALLTLHLVARPWAETIAWTVNIRAPRVNYFATGSSGKENITGTLFTENVRETDRNLLFNQTVAKDAEGRKSTIEIDTNNPIEWVEKYYRDSEQRPGKAFKLGNDDYAMITAQPDYDQEWFDSLDENAIRELREQEETKLLETRKFYFNCGCSEEKLIQAMIGFKDQPEELFGDDETITATCPRCSANYTFGRDIFDNIVIEKPESSNNSDTDNN